MVVVIDVGRKTRKAYHSGSINEMGLRGDCWYKLFVLLNEKTVLGILYFFSQTFISFRHSDSYFI